MLSQLKLPELRARCKQLGLTGYSKYNKAQLIARLEEVGNPAAAAPTIPAPTPRSLPAPVPLSTPKSNLTPPIARPVAPKLAPPSLAAIAQPPSRVASPPRPNPTTQKQAQNNTPCPAPIPLISGQTQSKSKFPLSSQKAPLAGRSNPKKAGSKGTSTTPYAKPVSKFKAPVPRQQIPPRAPPPKAANVPHRLPNISNTTFLAQHFASRIIQHLSPSALDRVIHKPLVHGSEKAFTVALTFWIHRLHTAMQMGGGEAWSVEGFGQGLLGPNIASWPTVSTCSVFAGDIWKIGTDDNTSYLCIGSTGEVIHRLPTPLRSDWAAYTSSPTPLLDCIKSKDTHEYPNGIFRGFLGGREERSMAERAVLSSCVLQSYSGESASLLAMEAEWLGQPIQTKASSSRVELFVPESHQIVSAHLTPHASVGIIQRHAGHAEYILRETGQIIGDEDGIVPFWQGILACDSKGNRRDHPSFWQGWEKRCAGETED